jgi:K+:H+ antiporter
LSEFDILRQLVVIFGAAVAVVLVLSRLRLPTIAGFIVAGAVMGPSGLGLVADPHDIEVLAEIGVVLLLFTIGLEFSLSELRRIGRIAALGGGLQVGLTTLAVVAAATRLGLPASSGVFYGFLVALSSTAIVLRALAERGETDAPHGRLIVAALLFQDLCVVPMMLIVPMLSGAGRGVWDIPLALGKAALVVVVTVALARRAAPPVLEMVARAGRRDLFVLTVLLICSGIAWLTSLVGLSLALGAFLAGIVLADSEYGHQALSDVLPLRDTLSSLFFISMGLLLDMKVVLSRPGTVAALVVAVLVGKTVLAAVAGLVMRFPLRVAVLAGIALAQVGEFSFVLAKLGARLGLMTPEEMKTFLAASVVTMLVTPVAVRLAPHLAAGAARLWILERLLGVRPDEDELAASEEPGGHVVILGYGVGGQLLAEALRTTGIPYRIVDINAERIRKARGRGEPALYGDVTSVEILERVHVEAARHVVVLLNDLDAATRAVRATRRLAPAVPILVRTRYLGEIHALRQAGATAVVAQEMEASVEVIDLVLRAAAVAGDVIGNRVRVARHRGPPGVPSLTIPRRPRGEAADLDTLKIESFLVHDGSWIGGRNLAESKLRTRTGSSLVAVSRHGVTVTHLAADDAIRVADVLHLVGDDRQIAAAVRLLESGPPS